MALAKNHGKVAAFASNSTERIPSLGLWRATPAFSGSQLPGCLLSCQHTYWAAGQSQQHGQHLGWEGRLARKVALFQNEETSPAVPTLCPHFHTPPATICGKLNAEREDGENARQPFISATHKHHPCCCLCLPTPGTKAPIRLIILPLRMFPLRGSLGLAAWQQASTEPGGHLLLQCQYYFRGVRLAGKKLLNSMFPRCREGSIKPSPHRWIEERHYAWYILRRS